VIAHTDIVAGYLVLSRLAHDLPHRLHQLLSAAGASRVKLSGRHLAAVGVDGGIAQVGGVVGVVEVADIALPQTEDLGILEATSL